MSCSCFARVDEANTVCPPPTLLPNSQAVEGTGMPCACGTCAAAELQMHARVFSDDRLKWFGYQEADKLADSRAQEMSGPMDCLWALGVMFFNGLISARLTC